MIRQRTRILAGWIGFLSVLIMPSQVASQSAVKIQAAASSNTGFVECRGFVFPGKRYILKLRPGERVVEVMISKGERVKPEQPLVKIDDPAISARFIDLTGRLREYEILRDEIAVFKLELELQQGNLERAKSKIERLRKIGETLPNYPIDKEMEELVDKSLAVEDQIKITSMRLTNSQARLRRQQNAVESLERELEAAKVRMEQPLVKAPFAGIVVETALDPHRLTPESTICELWDDSTLLVEMEILQHQLEYINPGRQAIVALDFGREERIQAAVESVEPASLVPDATGHPKFKAILRLDKPVTWLRPGMQVAVRVRSEGTK